MAVRRTIVSLTLLGFLAAGIGVPIPQIQFKSSGSYRCRGHACGCLTELMCRTSCCCFKPKPKATTGCHKCTTTAKADTSRRHFGNTSFVLAIHSLDCKGGAYAWHSVRNAAPFRCGALDARPQAANRRSNPGCSLMNPLALIQPDSPPPKLA